MKTITYINPGSFFDTDITVLSHLSKHYHVIWYPLVQLLEPCSLTKKEILDYANKYNIECRYTPIPFRLRDIRNFKLYWSILNEAKKSKTDLYYTCYKQIYLILNLKLLIPTSKIVYGFHDVMPHTGARKKLIKFLVKSATLFFNNFITFSKSQQKILKDIYRKDATVLGMSYKYIGPSCATLPPINNEVKLLFFGSIIKYKGLDLLIVALEKLYAKGVKNISLTVAGKGKDWAECEQLIKHKKLYNLQIRFIENSEVPDLMVSHHFLIQPYRDVTSSGPLMIAIAYGTPIIAPNIGYFADNLNSKSSILYPQGQLDDALLSISKMTIDEYDKIRKESQLLKEAYSEENIAKRYIQYFDDCLNNKIK